MSEKDRLSELSDRCRDTIKLSQGHYACILLTLSREDVRYVEVEAVLGFAGYTVKSFLNAWCDGAFDD